VTSSWVRTRSPACTTSNATMATTGNSRANSTAA